MIVYCLNVNNRLDKTKTQTDNAVYNTIVHDSFKSVNFLNFVYGVYYLDGIHEEYEARFEKSQY